MSIDCMIPKAKDLAAEKRRAAQSIIGELR